MKLKRLLIVAFTLLALSAITIFGISCSRGGNTGSPDNSANEATIKFNPNTDLETNVIKERYIVIGRRISEPKIFITGDNPDNLYVYGWYTTQECTESTRWDFKKGKVAGDMTLYAKWVELYDVNYYVNGEYHSTVEVFNGDYLEENAKIVEGYKYFGSFADADHSTAFDFSAPISGNTNVYISRSLGIYLSDDDSDGLLSSGSLTAYLVAACGSYNEAEGTEEGWVEEYTIASTGEKCTYVNYGLNPRWGDGYVEFSLLLDISHSQIIRLTYKNLGPATTANCYFTAMIDESTYSETGFIYNDNFNWPNFSGSGVAPLSIPSNMSETDDWATLDFNLYEVYKNGYSVWGTSPYLGELRIQINYKNTDEDDWSNEMLIKSIEGVPVDIEVVDSAEIQELVLSAQQTTENQLIEAGNLLPENANGIDFVKEYKSLSKVDGNLEVYPSVDGLLMRAENEIEARENGNQSKVFTVTVPEGKVISLDELTTLNITLQNFGYAEELSVYVYNENNVPSRATVAMRKQMFDSETYTINLYGSTGMKGNLKKIEFIYNSLGVDNVILFKSVTFSEFIPADVVGINFFDKFNFGMQSTEDVAISFDSKLKGSTFSVSKDGATVTSPDKAYDATNEGYDYMSLIYNVPEDSLITAVKVALKVNGVFGTEYVYNIEEKGNASVKLPLVKSEAGYVKAVRLTFVGTGKITIKELAYSVGELGLPFYKSYDTAYSIQPEWKGVQDLYEYDSKNQSSKFIKGPMSSYINFVMYIGYTTVRPAFTTPHTTKNILVTGKVSATVVYQNKTDVNYLGMHLSFDTNESGPGDGSIYSIYQKHHMEIDSNMGEYEWSSLTIELSGEDLTQFLNAYLAKVSFEFHGEEISIRAVNIEVQSDEEVTGSSDPELQGSTASAQYGIEENGNSSYSFYQGRYTEAEGNEEDCESSAIAIKLSGEALSRRRDFYPCNNTEVEV